MDRPYVRVMLIVMVLVLLLGQVAEGQVAVSGQVRGRQGAPKSSVRVQLEGPGRYVALTDNSGNFSVQNVQPGEYSITVVERNRIQKFYFQIHPGTGPLNLVVDW